MITPGILIDTVKHLRPSQAFAQVHPLWPHTGRQPLSH